MPVSSVLLPVFVQVGLAIALVGLLGSRRFAAARRREVRLADISLGERNWPPRAQAASNAYSHQFELPVLYFALVPLALITRKADLLFVVLSWAFVLSRIAHALIYVTVNHVPSRFAAFLAGVVVLAIMWIRLAVQVLGEPA